jgi:PhzF family phenazine biosynthesis protein
MDYFLIDAFSDKPFAGNQAGVCLLKKEPRAAWMQAVAAEMNVSETAFVWPFNGDFGLRWFTPAVEVPLCGHGTLAATHALFQDGKRLKERASSSSNRISFLTKSGRLSAQYDHDNSRIVLDFPSHAVTAQPYDSSRLFAEQPLFCGVTTHGHGEPTRLLELSSAQAVRELEIDLGPLRYAGAPGILVTARAEQGEPGVDFVSRFFVPSAGIDEDPVTGSAHCILAPYWAEKLGRSELRGYQASKRGGFVDVALTGDRVLLGGQATTVLRGQLSAKVAGLAEAER